jgi:2-polyprenyl-3-methyl-5-hydroxy-6-metoxy-1,4-benzoquinol methylase
MNKLSIDNSEKLVACPLCKGENTTKRVGQINYNEPIYFSTNIISIIKVPELYKCGRCKCCFTQYAIPQPIAKLLYTNGDGTKRWSYKNFCADKTSEVVNYMDNLFIPDLKVVDIGANTGELLDFAKERGCLTYGVEYSQTSMNILKDKGHKVLNSLEESNSLFDVICAFDLVEHLYDVPTFFNACFSRLNSNGVIVILTGNIKSFSSSFSGSKWWYVSYPEHVVFLSEKYISGFTPFAIKHSIKTYASNYHKNASLNRKNFVTFSKDLLHNKYNGVPSLTPDHLLLILHKK